MTVYHAPVEDIRFLLYNVLDFDKISQLPGYEDATPDMVDAILTEAARFYEDVLSPTNQEADLQGCRVENKAVVTAPVLEGIYSQLVEASWLSLSEEVEYGGQGMPHLLGLTLFEMITSANMAFSLLPLLTKGVVTALSKYGSQEQKDSILPYLVSGEWAGTMNLTEPQAGSDLAAVRSKAVPEGDHYRISGEKIFITWGDHSFTDNIIHLVLARTPDAPEGVKGISLFVVPKYQFNDDGSLGERNDVYPVSVEHKMGIHASPTCILSFGSDEGAIGYLVGEENDGLKYMFAMMNHARLCVGLQGVSLGERSYQQSVAYARDRVQGSVPDQPKAPIIKHPDVRRMLMHMRAMIEGGRALAFSAFAHEDFGLKSEDAEQVAYHHRRVDLLTPLVKGWCTEMGMEVTSLGVQVHGGMGFVEETGVAQHMRDIRIGPIYEGTNGIQAMDLVGRKFLRDGGSALKELLGEMSETAVELQSANNPELTALADALNSAIGTCHDVAEYIAGNVADDWALPGSAAYNFLMLTGNTVVCNLLSKSALAAVKLNDAGEGNVAFNNSKLITATFFSQQILPRNLAYAVAAKSGSEAIMAMADDAF